MILKEKYAVIGAGCGGQAIAGYLASIGIDVTLYNRSSNRIKLLRKEGYIDLEGTMKGRGQSQYIGTDMSRALAGRDIIMVVITADGHKEIAQKIAPYLRDGQIIILNPGRTCGVLEFDYTLRKCCCEADVVVAEANTLVFTVRGKTPGVATIKGVKREVSVSALNAGDTANLIGRIHSTFPQFVAATSFLETSFGNIGAIFHPAITLLNKNRILSKKTFDFYTEGVTKKVTDFIEKVDYEVQNVARALGAKPLSARDWLNSRYDLELSDLFTMIRSNSTYHGIKSPTSLNHRYLWEDIPTGLVPISSFGSALGVSTETINFLIDEGCNILKRNFWEEGRTPEKLGLSRENILSDLVKIIDHKKEIA